MAEYDSSKIGYTLRINGEYDNTLDIKGFSRMLKDPSYCYKFFWLEALVWLISEGVEETTFGTVIDEMIANAWYPVREFHIHLSGMQGGEVRDGLERAVEFDTHGFLSECLKKQPSAQMGSIFRQVCGKSVHAV